MGTGPQALRDPCTKTQAQDHAILNTHLQRSMALGNGAIKRRTSAFHCATQAFVSGNLAREQNQTQAEHALQRLVLS